MSTMYIETKPIIPKANVKLYAILDINNPIVAWEVAIGRICSACDPSKWTYSASIWFYSFLLRLSKDGLSQRFLNELRLEDARLKYSPKAVSRFRGVYFFKNEEDAKAAVERWPGFRRKEDFISAVNFSANDLTAVDSEWVTACINSNHHDWMEHYWAGETYGVKPLTEIFGSGIGMIQNMKLRSEACRLVYKKWPTSAPLLSMAACVFKESRRFSNLGMITPVISVVGEKIQGNHIIDIDALSYQDEVIRSLEKCKARGEVLPMIIPDNEEEFFHVPDLSSLKFELSGIKLGSMFNEIHCASVP